MASAGETMSRRMLQLNQDTEPAVLSSLLKTASTNVNLVAAAAAVAGSPDHAYQYECLHNKLVGEAKTLMNACTALLEKASVRKSSYYQIYPSDKTFLYTPREFICNCQLLRELIDIFQSLGQPKTCPLLKPNDRHSLMSHCLQLERGVVVDFRMIYSDPNWAAGTSMQYQNHHRHSRTQSASVRGIACPSPPPPASKLNCDLRCRPFTAAQKAFFTKHGYTRIERFENDCNVFLQLDDSVSFGQLCTDVQGFLLCCFPKVYPWMISTFVCALTPDCEKQLFFMNMFDSDDQFLCKNNCHHVKQQLPTTCSQCPSSVASATGGTTRSRPKPTPVVATDPLEELYKECLANVINTPLPGAAPATDAPHLSPSRAEEKQQHRLPEFLLMTDWKPFATVWQLLHFIFLGQPHHRRDSSSSNGSTSDSTSASQRERNNSEEEVLQGNVNGRAGDGDGAATGEEQQQQQQPAKKFMAHLTVLIVCPQEFPENLELCAAAQSLVSDVMQIPSSYLDQAIYQIDAMPYAFKLLSQTCWLPLGTRQMVKHFLCHDAGNCTWPTTKQMWASAQRQATIAAGNDNPHAAATNQGENSRVARRKTSGKKKSAGGEPSHTRDGKVFPFDFNQAVFNTVYHWKYLLYSEEGVTERCVTDLFTHYANSYLQFLNMARLEQVKSIYSENCLLSNRVCQRLSSLGNAPPSASSAVVATTTTPAVKSRSRWKEKKHKEESRLCRRSIGGVKGVGKCLSLVGRPEDREKTDPALQQQQDDEEDEDFPLCLGSGIVQPSPPCLTAGGAVAKHRRVCCLKRAIYGCSRCNMAYFCYACLRFNNLAFHRDMPCCLICSNKLCILPTDEQTKVE